MNRYGRFRAARRGVFLPRSVHSGIWADKALESDPSLPKDEAFRWGMICAHSLHQRPDAQGVTNHFDSDADSALWQRGYDRAKVLIAHYGV